MVNFLSYVDETVSFADGLTLISGWNADQNSANGSGKSAILDAISVCLFNDSPRNLRLDEYTNRTSKTSVLELKLESDGHEYIIIRSRNPNTLKFFKDGHQLMGQDNGALQKLIEKEMSISYQVFINAAYHSQFKSGRFLLANDEEKRNVLLDILNLDDFTSAHERVVKDKNSLSIKQDRGKADVSNLESLIKNNTDKLQKCVECNDKFDDEKNSDLESIKKELESLNKDLKDQENEISGLSYDKSDYDNRLARYVKATELNNSVNEAEKKQIKLSVEMPQLLKELEAQLKLCESFNQGICPTCNQNIRQQKLIDNATQKAKTIGEKYNKVKKELENTETFITLNSDNIKKELEESKLELDKLAGIKTKIEACERIKDNIVSRISELEKRKVTVIGRENGYTSLIEDLKKEIKDSELKMGSIKNDLVVAAKNMDLLEVAHHVLGPQGVRSTILDNSIAFINQTLIGYLAILFDKPILAQFEIEQKDTAKTSRQKINTIILFDGAPVSFESLSGGEKKRIMIAVDLAIADLIASRYGRSINTLFLDEISEGLCSSGREKLFELLNTMKNKTILIIDHAIDFKQQFDRIIEVEKKGGVSRCASLE